MGTRDSGAGAAHRPVGGSCSKVHRYAFHWELPRDQAMMRAGLFAAAYGLDWIAGDPDWLPHPVQLIGAAISRGERLLRQRTVARNELADGAILAGAIVSGSWMASKAVSRAGGLLAETVLAWTALATRSLLD